MPYSVLFQPSARKALLKLPRSVQSRVLDAVSGLAQEPRPHGVAKLAGADDIWRIRVGEYRVVYEVHDKRVIVLVLVVAHRREVYR